jgi:glyoxylase-like metal-dependent hydrolase (beta-lactamase superfamily II)
MLLQYDVWYSLRGSATRNAPPGLEDLKVVPTSHTLIYGEQDAILVDTPLFAKATDELIEWIKAFSKNLKYIYITHPHGDHYFGLSAILQAFPSAKAVATKSCVAHMKAEIENELGAKPRFTAWFPGEVAKDLIPASELTSDRLELEGEILQIVPTGHTDTDETSTLFVPSLELAVTGDAVYNHVHPYMMETETREKLDAWLKGLEIIRSLNPRLVVGGHKDPNMSDDAKCITETKEYFADMLRLNEQTSDREELYKAMLAIHGTRLNPGSLWGATSIVKSSGFASR